MSASAQQDAEDQALYIEGWRKWPDVHKARKILERPVFGSPDHIAAVRLLSMVEELSVVSGDQRYMPCPCCEGSGGCECGECGHHADCHRCQGEGRVRVSEIEDCSPDEVKRMLETARREVRVQ